MAFKKRKGQNMIIEEAILMSMGIIILIGLTVVFTMTKDDISTSIQKEEASHIGNYIRGHITRIVLNNLTGSIYLPIPREINDRYYTIQGYNSGEKKEFFIMLQSQVHTTQSLVPVIGSATSEKGTIFINYTKVDGEYKIYIQS